MKRLCITFFVIFFTVSAFSQNAVHEGTVTDPAKKLEALKGTYELVRTSRGESLLPIDLADFIEKNRKDKEVNRIRLNDNYDMIIYPRNNIANNSELNKR